MRERGIDTDIHYPVPDHLQAGLEPPVRATDLRECERAADEVLTLPCFQEMTSDEVEHVASVSRPSGGRDERRRSLLSHRPGVRQSGLSVS